MTLKLFFPKIFGIFLLGTLLSQISITGADNPIVQTSYTADPAPLVHDGRIYLFTGHDEDNSTNFDMRDWLLFSSDDMANWKHHGSPLSVHSFSWANNSAWAGQAIARNGKFYFYVPMRTNSGSFAFGVGVTDDLTKPFTDAIGRPLISNSEIDPTVFIDDDRQAYLYYGNPNLWYAKLNDDMVSLNGEPTQVELTTTGFGARTDDPKRLTMYEEGPWIYKREGLYYLVYAANCCSEDIRYSTGPSAIGPWTYGGVIMPAEGRSFTNHPGVVDYRGQSYFFYHNGALPGGSGYTRSVSIERFDYNANGSFPTITMTTSGPQQVKALDPYVRQQAATIAWSEGIKVEYTNVTGVHVGIANNGGYIKVEGVQFGDGAASFEALVDSDTAGGNIELRVGGVNGTLVGTALVENTGGRQQWKTVCCSIDGAVGVADLFFRFTGSGDYPLFNIEWWQFSGV